MSANPTSPISWLSFKMSLVNHMSSTLSDTSFISGKRNYSVSCGPIIWMLKAFSPFRPHLSFLVSIYRLNATRSCISDFGSTHQAYPSDPSVSDPIGVIVCKQSMHREASNRGYIAMLSVSKEWRKRGIGSSPLPPPLLSSHQGLRYGINTSLVRTLFFPLCLI